MRGVTLPLLLIPNAAGAPERVSELALAPSGLRGEDSREVLPPAAGAASI